MLAGMPISPEQCVLMLRDVFHGIELAGNRLCRSVDNVKEKVKSALPTANAFDVSSLQVCASTTSFWRGEFTQKCGFGLSYASELHMSLLSERTHDCGHYWTCSHLTASDHAGERGSGWR